MSKAELIQWPPVVGSTRLRLVSTRTLTPAQKRILWEGLKQDDPAVAKQVETDPNIREMLERFDGAIAFELSDFNRYVRAGMDITKQRQRRRS